MPNFCTINVFAEMEEYVILYYTISKMCQNDFGFPKNVYFVKCMNGDRVIGRKPWEYLLKV